MDKRTLYVHTLFNALCTDFLCPLFPYELITKELICIGLMGIFLHNVLNVHFVHAYTPAHSYFLHYNQFRHG